MADVTETEITTKVSPRSVTDTVSRLTGILSAKGMKVFAVIDQSAEASQVGMRLRETTLVMFGNPAAGTPVMTAAPLAALDLPLKVLVWDDAGGADEGHLCRARRARRALSAERRPHGEAGRHRSAHRRVDRSVARRVGRPGRLSRPSDGIARCAPGLRPHAN